MLEVPAAVLTQVVVVPGVLAAAAAAAATTELPDHPELQALQEIPAATETPAMVAAALVVAVAPAVVQPVSTFAACRMSHLQITEQCKEAQPNEL